MLSEIKLVLCYVMLTDFGHYGLEYQWRTGGLQVTRQATAQCSGSSTSRLCQEWFVEMMILTSGLE